MRIPLRITCLSVAVTKVIAHVLWCAAIRNVYQMEGFTLCLSTACIYWSVYYILQHHILKQWPSMNLSATVIANISNKVLSILHASMISTVGIYVMWETADDCLYSRSMAITPFTYVGVSYMMCDMIAKYHIYCKTFNVSCFKTDSVFMFIRRRFLFILHHLVLIIGYPLFVYDSLRKGMGDFLIGTLFIRELSTPLLDIVKIMRKIGYDGSLVYLVNGILLVCVFFIVRVANTPLTLLLYSAQHHHWNVYQGLSAMRPVCHIMLVADLTLQVYWFTKLLITSLLTFRTKLKSS